MFTMISLLLSSDMGIADVLIGLPVGARKQCFSYPN